MRFSLRSGKHFTRATALRQRANTSERMLGPVMRHVGMAILLPGASEFPVYNDRRELGNGVAKNYIEWERSQRNKPTTRCSQCRREIEHCASCSSVSLPDSDTIPSTQPGHWPPPPAFLPFSAVIYKLLAFTLAMIVAPIGTYYLTLNTIFRGLSVLFKLSLFQHFLVVEKTKVDGLSAKNRELNTCRSNCGVDCKCCTHCICYCRHEGGCNGEDWSWGEGKKGTMKEINRPFCFRIFFLRLPTWLRCAWNLPFELKRVMTQAKLITRETCGYVITLVPKEKGI